ncbi:MAG TPA: sigma-70 family RNA polymerase sigma factor [Lacipirellulaceae bacterium]
MTADATSGPSPAKQVDFATTHWSVVLAAGGRIAPAASQALEQLCEGYWYPVYAYVRRRVPDVHQAQDLTQAFFEQLLERRALEAADPERGRFRAFLLTACKRFLINEWHKDRAAKRGGGQRPLSFDFDSGESKLGLVAADTLTPDELYDQKWAITLLERVMDQLRAEYAAKQRLPHFETLKNYLAGSPQDGSFATAAQALGISETTAKVAAHRMRKRYRELLRGEIAQTLQRPEEIDEEIRELFNVLGGEKNRKGM